MIDEPTETSDGPASAVVDTATPGRSGPARRSGSRRPPPRFSRDDPEIRRAKLISAAIRCIAEGGMSAFRVERICDEAKVSRGLLNHYFASKNDLLVAVYRTVLYDDLNFQIAHVGTAKAGPAKPGRNGATTDEDGAAEAVARLTAILDGMLSPSYFEDGKPTVWLALWSEIAVNPTLKAAHRALYRDYRDALESALGEVAAARGITVDAVAMARNLIALVDGLSLERALDPEAIGLADIRSACDDFIAVRLGAVG